MFFIPGDVYDVDPASRSLDTNFDRADFYPADVIDDPRQAFYSHGIGKLALAAFGHAFDEHGVSYLDLLVVEHGNDVSLLAPSQLVAEQPENYLSLELARKLTTLDPNELAQLTVPQPILDQIDKSYPGLKPLDKNYH